MNWQSWTPLVGSLVALGIAAWTDWRTSNRLREERRHQQKQADRQRRLDQLMRVSDLYAEYLPARERATERVLSGEPVGLAASLQNKEDLGKLLDKIGIPAHRLTAALQVLPGQYVTLLRYDLGLDDTIDNSAGEKWQRYVQGALKRPVDSAAIYTELREDIASSTPSSISEPAARP